MSPANDYSSYLCPELMASYLFPELMASRVGWFFSFFGISWKVMGLQFPKVQYGELPNFFILVQKPVRATPLKDHNFKKIQGAKYIKKYIFFLKNVFFNAHIILEDNQILN